MDARLPFRNTYHKGFSLVMGQTRYHAPDENGCLPFDGRIIIHDYIPTNTLRALSLLPRVTVCFVPCASLVTVRQSIHLHILFIIHFLPAQMRFLCFTPNTTLCDAHSFRVYLRFPIPPVPFPTIPSTALRSEYTL